MPAYSNLPIGTANPTLMMILVDQSGSMSDPIQSQGKPKSELAAIAVNRVIYEILLSCQSGNKIKDRCFVGVIGYGSNVDVLVGGMISQVAEKPIRIEKVQRFDGAGGLVEFDLPIWIDPIASGGTPMAEAFDSACDVIDEWVKNNPASFPPIVINITDGEPNSESKAETAARKVMNRKTTDGNTLILNAHISDTNAREILLPSNHHGLPNNFANFLFNISSVLPDPLFKAAQKVGFSPQADARGFVFNAGAETLIKLLNFGSAAAR